ncbi:MAG TPA: hypothetical protein VE631_03220, partial [Alphaproteobacteria bacterium]|nr:hypothetical protein [Alphaproteobacteria bacterium]
MAPPGDMTPELLVLEPAPYGHGREWLLHLAAYARRCEPVPRLAFAVAPPVAEALRRELALAPVPGLSIHALTEREVAGCTQPKLALSALARWQVMRRLLRRTGARHGFFLELDHLSLPLALGLPLGGGRSVSGILFRPSVHYETAARRAGDARREARKNLLYRAMLRHRAVARVHTLDDAFPDFARTRYRDGGKVTALVDPAFPPVAPTVADRALAERAPEDRALFALFGVLSERKGVLALLR